MTDQIPAQAIADSMMNALGYKRADAKTPVAELRTAVARLRCDHGFPCNPPGGSAWAPGPCVECGMPWDDKLLLPPEALREPLAAWLGSLDGIEFHEHAPMADEFTHALTIARKINGGDR